MTLYTHKRLIQVCGLLLLIWAGILVVEFIELIGGLNALNRWISEAKYEELISKLEKKRLEQYISLIFTVLLIVPSIVTALGLWFYKNWARISAVVISSISALFVFYVGIKAFIADYKLHKLIEESEGSIMCILHADPPVIWYLMIIACAVFITVVMLNKNTKLLFERKGKLE
ncbi:MAG: hypothetical protein HY811_03685 [Planctomycetes bacterium]|nr:hypothetical protein [Planctomycetota bacterium]